MDCMEVLYDLKELLTKELDKIVEKHDINPAELEMSYKAVDIIKDICTIDAMENAAEDEWDEEASYRGGSYEGGGYSGRRGYSRAGGGRSNRGSYEGGGYSGRRGYSRAGRGGRGSYEGGGSGNSYRMSYDDAEMSKEHMMQKIDEMQRQLQQM